MSRPGDTIGVRPEGLDREGGAESALSALPETPSSDRRTRIGLAAIAGVFAVALLAYVVRYGRNMFFWDDFELVPGLTGQQPTNLSWFFAWQNEHLVVLVRTVYYVVWHTTEDTRVMMLLVAGGMIVATFLMLDTARSLRGHAAWSDAIIPLLMLNWGHYQNLIFPLQFFFIWSVAFAAALLWAFVRARDGWRATELTVVLVTLPLLPLNGVIGAMFAAPFVLLSIRALLERALAKDEHSRRDATVLGIAAVATIGTLILNLSGARRMSHHPPADSIAAVFSSISEVFAISIGPAGIPSWPASGIAMAIVVVIAGGLVIFARRQSSSQRRALEACAASLAGFAGLVCAIGYGRAGLGPTVAFASRYSVFSGALVCIAAVVIAVYWKGIGGRIVTVTVLTIAIAAQPLAFSVGREYGHDLAAVCDRILSEMANGVPYEVVAHRDGLVLYPSSDGLKTFFRDLAISGEGAIGRRIHGQTECIREIPVSPVVEHANTMTWTGRVADCRGEDPFTVFALPAATRVCGVRVRFRMTDSDPTTVRLPMQTFWAQSSRNGFTPYERTQTEMVDAHSETVQSVTFWIGDTIDRFRIDPNTRDCQFELIDLTLITQ